jgi:hypothetical protein
MQLACRKCGWKNDAQARECARCGVIFAQLKRTPPPAVVGVAEELAVAREASPSWLRRWVGEHLLHIPADTSEVEVVGRGLVWTLLAYWGSTHPWLDVMEGEINNTFLHRVNLVFHEAGHIIFGVFGDFVGVAGGTLGQLVMPAMVLVAFVVKHRNSFGGAVALWWLGQSCLDVAPYACDARKEELILLGGVTGKEADGFHDWNNMLGRLDLLQWDMTIGWGFWGAGVGMMGLALAWGAWLLWKQWGVARGQRF